MTRMLLKRHDHSALEQVAEDVLVREEETLLFFNKTAPSASGAAEATSETLVS